MESAEGNEPEMDAYGFSRSSSSSSLESMKQKIPQPKNGEVLVKIHAVTLNSLDCKYEGQSLTFIPATDIAGDVHAVGRDVTKFRKTNSVIVKLPLITSGGLAEYVVAPVNLTVLRPSELSAVEGSGLGTALTAFQALDLLEAKYDGSGKPRNILITDASRGVGHYAVQLAKLANFHVTAACGGSKNSGEFLKKLGADEVVYKNDDGSLNVRSPSGRKYDCVIDCTRTTTRKDFKSNLNAPAKIVFTQTRRRNKFRSHLGKITNSDTQVVCMELAPKLEYLEFLVDLAVQGKIKTRVNPFSFGNAKDAWSRSMDDDVNGNVVVKLID